MTKIKVAIKLRPLIDKELAKGKCVYWDTSPNTIFEIGPSAEKPRSVSYCFDHVFGADSSNEQVYNTAVQPLVEQVVNGFNATVFAYGQTSSGKTFTMLGDKTQPGIIPLTISSMFNTMEQSAGRQFLVRASYMEIYNEQINDLLAKKENLMVREDEGKVVVVDLKEEVVASVDKVMTLIKKGERNRRIGETNMNERSSRSHTIFRLIVESRDGHATDEDDQVIKVAHLNLVDLAGSERVNQTGNKVGGDRFKEGCAINRSLFMLSLVIQKLSEGSDTYINYRNSKLTRILQSSLGGNALTVIICAVTAASLEETHSTLGFASRARNIKNKPEVNEVMSDGTLLKRYASQLKKLKSEMEKLKGTGVSVEEMESKLQEKDKMNIILQERIDRLSELLIGYSENSKSLEVTQNKRRMTWCAPQHKRYSMKPVIELPFQNIHASDMLSNATQLHDDEFHKIPLEQFERDLLEEEMAVQYNSLQSSSDSLSSFLQSEYKQHRGHLFSPIFEEDETFKYNEFEPYSIPAEEFKQSTRDFGTQMEIKCSSSLLDAELANFLDHQDSSDKTCDLKQKLPLFIPKLLSHFSAIKQENKKLNSVAESSQEVIDRSRNELVKEISCLSPAFDSSSDLSISQLLQILLTCIVEKEKELILHYESKITKFNESAKFKDDCIRDLEQKIEQLQNELKMNKDMKYELSDEIDTKAKIVYDCSYKDEQLCDMTLHNNGLKEKSECVMKYSVSRPEIMQKADLLIGKYEIHSLIEQCLVLEQKLSTLHNEIKFNHDSVLEDVENSVMQDISDADKCVTESNNLVHNLNTTLLHSLNKDLFKFRNRAYGYQITCHNLLEENRTLKSKLISLDSEIIAKASTCVSDSESQQEGKQLENGKQTTMNNNPDAPQLMQDLPENNAFIYPNGAKSYLLEESKIHQTNLNELQNKNVSTISLLNCDQAAVDNCFDKDYLHKKLDFEDDESLSFKDGLNQLRNIGKEYDSISEKLKPLEEENDDLKMKCDAHELQAVVDENNLNTETTVSCSNLTEISTHEKSEVGGILPPFPEHNADNCLENYNKELKLCLQGEELSFQVELNKFCYNINDNDWISRKRKTHHKENYTLNLESGADEAQIEYNNPNSEIETCTHQTMEMECIFPHYSELKDDLQTRENELSNANKKIRYLFEKCTVLENKLSVLQKENVLSVCQSNAKDDSILVVDCVTQEDNFSESDVPGHKFEEDKLRNLQEEVSKLKLQLSTCEIKLSTVTDSLAECELKYSSQTSNLIEKITCLESEKRDILSRCTETDKLRQELCVRDTELKFLEKSMISLLDNCCELHEKLKSSFIDNNLKLCTLDKDSNSEHEKLDKYNLYNGGELEFRQIKSCSGGISGQLLDGDLESSGGKPKLLEVDQDTFTVKNNLIEVVSALKSKISVLNNKYVSDILNLLEKVKILGEEREQLIRNSSETDCLKNELLQKSNSLMALAEKVHKLESVTVDNDMLKYKLQKVECERNELIAKVKNYETKICELNYKISILETSNICKVDTLQKKISTSEKEKEQLLDHCSETDCLNLELQMKYSEHVAVRCEMDHIRHSKDVFDQLRNIGKEYDSISEKLKPLEEENDDLKMKCDAHELQAVVDENNLNTETTVSCSNLTEISTHEKSEVGGILPPFPEHNADNCLENYNKELKLCLQGEELSFQVELNKFCYNINDNDWISRKRKTHHKENYTLNLESGADEAQIEYNNPNSEIETCTHQTMEMECIFPHYSELKDDLQTRENELSNANKKIRYLFEKCTVLENKLSVLQKENVLSVCQSNAKDDSILVVDCVTQEDNFSESDVPGHKFEEDKLRNLQEEVSKLKLQLSTCEIKLSTVTDSLAECELKYSSQTSNLIEKITCLESEKRDILSRCTETDKLRQELCVRDTELKFLEKSMISLLDNCCELHEKLKSSFINNNLKLCTLDKDSNSEHEKLDKYNLYNGGELEFRQIKSCSGGISGQLLDGDLESSGGKPKLLEVDQDTFTVKNNLIEVVSALKSKISVLNNKYESDILNLLEKVKILGEEREQLIRNSSETDCLKNELLQKSNSLMALAEKVHKLESVTVDNDMLKYKLQKVECERNELIAKVKNYETKICELNDKISILETSNIYEVNSLQNKICTLEKEKEQLLNHCNETDCLKLELQKKHSELVAVRCEMDHLKQLTDDIGDLKKLLQAAENENVCLQTKIQTNENLIASLQNCLPNDIKGACRDIETLHSDLTGILPLAAIQYFRLELDHLRSEISNFLTFHINKVKYLCEKVFNLDNTNTPLLNTVSGKEKTELKICEQEAENSQQNNSELDMPKRELQNMSDDKQAVMMDLKVELICGKELHRYNNEISILQSKIEQCTHTQLESIPVTELINKNSSVQNENDLSPILYGKNRKLLLTINENKVIVPEVKHTDTELIRLNQSVESEPCQEILNLKSFYSNEIFCLCENLCKFLEEVENPSTHSFNSSKLSFIEEVIAKCNEYKLKISHAKSTAVVATQTFNTDFFNEPVNTNYENSEYKTAFSMGEVTSLKSETQVVQIIDGNEMLFQETLHLQKSNDKLIEENTSLEQKLSDKCIPSQDTETLLADIEEQVKRIEQLNSQVVLLEEQLNQETQKNGQLGIMCSEKQNLISKLEYDLETKTLEVGQMNDENEMMCQEVLSLQKLNDKLIEENISLEQKLSDKCIPSQDTETLLTDIEEQKKRIEQLNSQIVLLEEQLNQETQKNGQLELMCSEKQNLISKLEYDLETKTLEVGQMDDENEMMCQEVLSLQKLNDKLIEENISLEQKLSVKCITSQDTETLLTDIEEQKKRIEQLNSRVVLLEEQLNQETQKNGQLEIMCSEKQNLISKLEYDLETKTLEVGQMNDENETMCQEVLSLQKLNDKLIEENISLEQKLSEKCIPSQDTVNLLTDIEEKKGIEQLNSQMELLELCRGQNSRRITQRQAVSLESLCRDCISLKEQVHDLEKEKIYILNEYKIKCELEIENTITLEDKIVFIGKQNTKLENDNFQLKKENIELLHKYQELQKRLQMKCQDDCIGNVAVTIGTNTDFSHEGSCEDFEEMKHKMRLEIVNGNCKISKLECDNEEQATRIKTLERDLATTKLKIKDLECQLIQYQSRNPDAKTKSLHKQMLNNSMQTDPDHMFLMSGSGIVTEFLADSYRIEARMFKTKCNMLKELCQHRAKKIRELKAKLEKCSNCQNDDISTASNSLPFYEESAECWKRYECQTLDENEENTLMQIHKVRPTRRERNLSAGASTSVMRTLNGPEKYKLP